jgi:hypothetical protein
LFGAGQPAGAYYLAGYAVECGLKACIAKSFRRYELPDKKLVNDSYTHNLLELVRLAGLWAELNAHMQQEPTFQRNWLVVKDWSEASRYGVPLEIEARDLISSISARRYGILPWIKQRW